MGGVFLDRGWDRGLPEPQCLKAKRSWHRVQEEAGHPHIHTPSLTGWWQPQASSFWENTSHRTKHGQQTLQNVQKAQLWLCPHPGGIQSLTAAPEVFLPLCHPTFSNQQAIDTIFTSRYLQNNLLMAPPILLNTCLSFCPQGKVTGSSEQPTRFRSVSLEATSTLWKTPL